MNTKFCNMCVANQKVVDYKNIEVLKKYLDSYGRIVAHRKSGVCTSHQRKLATAIKRARFLALLPFITR